MTRFKTFLKGILCAGYVIGASGLAYLTIPWLIPRLFVCFLMGVLGAYLYRKAFNEDSH